MHGFSAVCLGAGGRPQSVSLGSDGEVTVCRRLGCLNYSDPILCQLCDGDIFCLPSVIFQDISEVSLRTSDDKNWDLCVLIHILEETGISIIG